jgi:soluble lytic murein transglycosylase-like protein
VALPDTAALPQLEPRYRRGHPATSPTDLIVLIENKAIAHSVPLELAHAVVRVESNYDHRLTGRGGALGLMQIKYLTARGMGFKGSAQDLYDPAVNLEWGMRYLAGARKLAKGDICGTVMRYQGGHMAARMTAASTVYCGKVRALIGKSSDASRFERKTVRR